MSGRIILFGATGYTGELTAHELVARGARPVLAGRSAERLVELARRLGGLETRVADVSRPDTVRALVERGDVLVSTVGPFTRWGDPAVEAAVDAGAHYLDSTGEPPFIRRIFDHYGPRAEAAGCALLTAFGFDWLPGNLAGALSLEAAGNRAVSLEIGYFGRGSAGISGGTRASTLEALIEPSFAYRGGRLRTERAGARARSFTSHDGEVRRGISVGGTEHFSMPRLYPALRDVEVVLGQSGPLVQAIPFFTGAIALAAKIPLVRPALSSVVHRLGQGSTGGPGADSRAKGSCTIVADAKAATGELLRRVWLHGPNGYTFTARILAWGAIAASTGGLRAVGAVGPVEAFGREALRVAAADAGLRVAELGQA